MVGGGTDTFGTGLSIVYGGMVVLVAVVVVGGGSRQTRVSYESYR
jgi:hypothetical protein